MHPNRSPADDLPLTEELAEVFARMSGLLLTESTVTTALEVLSSLARETVPGSVGAGMSLVAGRHRTSSGSTDARVQEADDLQYGLDEGPCLTAATTGEPVRVDDLATDRRWPRWAAAALALGLRATMSAPLQAGDSRLGAMKVYADRPGTFDSHGEHLLGLFAGHAAVLVAHVRDQDRSGLVDQAMREAIGDRDAIHTATGILMARSNLDAEGALTVLLRQAQQDGGTLAATARDLIESTVRRQR